MWSLCLCALKCGRVPILPHMDQLLLRCTFCPSTFSYSAHRADFKHTAQLTPPLSSSVPNRTFVGDNFGQKPLVPQSLEDPGLAPLSLWQTKASWSRSLPPVKAAQTSFWTRAGRRAGKGGRQAGGGTEAVSKPASRQAPPAKLQTQAICLKQKPERDIFNTLKHITLKYPSDLHPGNCHFL